MDDRAKTPPQAVDDQQIEPDAESDLTDSDEQLDTTSELAAEEGDNDDFTDDESEDELIIALRAEVRENFDKYLRAVADLENYKKRTLKERSDLLKYAGEPLARDLLDVVDNLERAVAQAPAEGGAFVEGVRMVLSSFMSILERHGIRGEAALGGPFDPNRHEALASVPTSEVPGGQILEQFRKAYFFKDRLLRPAQVVVSVEAPAPNGTEDESDQ